MGMAGMTEETAEQKLKRHEDALAACMIEITKLREENAKLRSEKSDALSVLREIYSDPDASQAHRIKAAGLALPHEVPRLTSQPPPLELAAEEIEPLAVVVERQRKR
jgi:FtsZ-binding cell division protein ZapB